MKSGKAVMSELAEANKPFMSDFALNDVACTLLKCGAIVSLPSSMSTSVRPISSNPSIVYPDSWMQLPSKLLLLGAVSVEGPLGLADD